MVSRSVLLIASTTLIAGALLAPGAGATVLGPSSGVTATRNGAQVDVAFTPGALAGSMLKTGRTVGVECDVAPPAAKLLLADSKSDNGHIGGYGEGKVGDDGVARITLDGDINDQQPGVLDYCTVDRVRHIGKNGSTDNTVARVSLTPAGAVYVDESERASALRRLLQKAHTASGYQPVAALGAGVVALDSPDATPPAGQTGYWTDGTHAAVVTLSAAGRRLLIQDEGGLILRSDVFDEMDPLGLDDIDPSQVAAAASGSSQDDDSSPDADKKPTPYKSNNPLQPADGVRATVRGHRATVRFTGRAARTLRALRGRRVSVWCLPAPEPALWPSLVDELLHPSREASGGVGVARVPARGDAVSATLKGGTGDVCFVVDDRTVVATVGGTAAGKGWMQDLAALNLLDVTLGLVAPGGQSYLPAAKVAAAGRKNGLVAMSGPDGAVPVGKVGVWTDGAKQAAVAVVSPTGRRFVIADEGDGIGRTNTLSLYSSLFLSTAFALETGDTSLSFFG